MHSYDNGTATKAKRENWNLLLKVFRKVGLTDMMTEQEAHWITSLEDGAAVNFLCRAYETLTQRKLSMQVKPAAVTKVAGYARDNSVMKVRKALQHNDLQEGYDVDRASRMMASVVQDHEQSLQGERFTEPDRYSVTSSVKSINNPTKRPTGMRDEIPVVTAKEIQVKQLDRNITHLRAAKEIGQTQQQQNSPGRTGSPRPVSPAGSEGNNGGWSPDRDSISLNSGERLGSLAQSVKGPGNNQSTATSSSHLIPENSLSLLNACIARVANRNPPTIWAAKLDPFTNFMSLINQQRPNSKFEYDELISEILYEIQLSASMLADSCVVTPKQFWKVSDLFCAVVTTAPQNSRSFKFAIESFKCIGLDITERDANSSIALFCDFTLQKLATTLINNPSKRLGILTLLHAFTPNYPQAHVQCIKRLKNCINDNLPVFISCLCILATQEEVLDELLLDLYAYYGNIGLSSPSPKLRAASLAMLRALLPEGEVMVATNLIALEQSVSSEMWWEEIAYVIALCGQYLGLQLKKNRIRDDVSENSGKQILSNNDDDREDIRQGNQAARSILQKLLGDGHAHHFSVELLLWCIQSIAGCVGFDRNVDALFLGMLRDLPADEQRFALGLVNEDNNGSTSGPGRTLHLPSSTDIPFKLQPVTQTWSAISAARMIEGMIYEENLDRLDGLSMQILHAAILTRTQLAAGANSLSGPWLDVYSKVKNHVIVGFCDPSTIISAVGIVTSYIFNSELKEQAISDPKFVGLFRLLYTAELGLNPEDIQACQFVFETFMRDTFKAGPPYNTAVYQIVHQFSKSSSTIFATALSLQKLLKEFSAMMR